MVVNTFFDRLSALPSTIAGLIIDVRNNGGGDLADLNFLVGHLIGKPLLFGFTRAKSGNGRLDFTPWVEATVQPQTGVNPFPLPIVVLADNYSASLAETLIMAIHALPNGRVVGETTWGATGPIVDRVLLNDGPFQVPGFLSVYTSSVEFRYLDGKSYEGKGFPPDVKVPFDQLALFEGDDPALTAAIGLIR